jgi:hypothetical protein
MNHSKFQNFSRQLRPEILRFSKKSLTFSLLLPILSMGEHVAFPATPKTKQNTMHLSELLIRVLNAHETTSRDVSHLIERWELAEATVGHRHGWFAISDLSYIEGEGGFAHIDESCECERCSEFVLSQTITDVNRINSRGNRFQEVWCSACEDSHSFYCRACDRTFSDDLSRETIHGDLVCSNCFEEEEEEDNASLLPSYHNARRPYSPFDLQKEKVYSVELEVESSQRNALLKHLMENPIERTVWESDGSLEHDKGVEFLICFQQDTEKLKSVLSQLVDVAKKFQSTSWVNTRCGCHINSNKPRNLWTASKVMKLLWLVRQFKTTLQTISGRDSNHYCSWNNLPSLRSWSLGYCEKYTCVRVGCDRIEWRMFRGTLNKARLNLYIDVVRLLEDYALKYSIHELRERHHEIAISLHALTEIAKKNGAKL